MRLQVLPGELSVCRLPAGVPVADLVDPTVPLWGVVRRGDETSVVCPVGSEPVGARVEGPWRAVEVLGPLEFSLVGVLASLAVPLAEAGISIFALSTFDTDVLLVAAGQLERAVAVLTDAGHELVGDE